MPVTTPKAGEVLGDMGIPKEISEAEEAKAKEADKIVKLPHATTVAVEDIGPRNALRRSLIRLIRLRRQSSLLRIRKGRRKDRMEIGATDQKRSHLHL